MQLPVDDFRSCFACCRRQLYRSVTVTNNIERVRCSHQFEDEFDHYMYKIKLSDMW
jgi:hypothetical protein